MGRSSSAPEISQSLEPLRVLIPAGEFWMGSEDGQEEERPVHRVWVDAFEMAVHQVRNRDYRMFLQATRREAPPLWNDPLFNHPDQPVVSVSWFDAVAYCEWLSKVPASVYRLPREAEWERAARGGHEGARFPWGDEPPEQAVPDYARRWREAPEPVGLYPSGPYGLSNMGDNVHEWCLDWFDPNYYAHSPRRNPRGPEYGVLGAGGVARRASRGGSWRHHVKVARTAARSSIPPEFKYADYGFRVVRQIATTDE